ncbi:WD40 repeat domain-containing protein [Streptomyces liliifuscus]|uniref:WD40 repeat domain-containing protein n=1 Tax=Streptomyces liliifuscus TaxID=2797636 RepID=A0A7T7L4H5_9ACTN|nr:WD40 repeat domain-containing protein [Streptomyces liliifuscus]QQM46204.1 WD40 repeat domain-containing protein [Streptomyces liliifuscus]
MVTTEPAACSWTDEETVAANAAGRLAPAQLPLLTGASARIMSAVGRIADVPGAEPEVRAAGVRIEVRDDAAPLPPSATYRLYWLAPAEGVEGRSLLLSAQPLDAQHPGEQADAVAVEVGRVPAGGRWRRRSLLLAGLGAAAVSAAGVTLSRLSSRRGSRADPGRTAGLFTPGPSGAGPVDASLAPVPRLTAYTEGIRYVALMIDAGEVTTLAFSPDGRTLAGGISDGTIRLWAAKDGRPTALLTDARRFSPVEVAFHPDGTTLADARDAVHLWKVASRRMTAVLALTRNVTDDHAWCVAFSPDGAFLASGHSFDYLRLWDVASRSNVGILHGHSAFVLAVAFSPDGRLLASGSHDASVRLWDVAGRSSVATLTGHSSTVHSVAFSPDGTTLASSSYDRTIRLWDVSSARTIAVLNGHTSAATSVAFSPDGRMLASGGAGASSAFGNDYPDDHTVRLWDVARRTNVATLTGHTGAVRSVVFSPDGTTLASGSNDGTVRLWEIR